MYMNIPSTREDLSNRTGGNINTAYETLDLKTIDDNAEYCDVDAASIRNTQSNEQLKLPQKKTKAEYAKYFSFVCNIDRKLIVIIIIGAFLLVMVAVAIAVYFATQKGEESAFAGSGWAKWSSWGSCSVSCSTGTQERLRLCTASVDDDNGSTCPGSDRQVQNCTIVDCPINGGWTIWGFWETCSKSCGTGEQMRHRTCTNPIPFYGGKMCDGQNREMQACTTINCPIDGSWSLWSSWSSCSVSCGTGTSQRTRSCSQPAPQHGGEKCSGEDKQTKTCTLTSFLCSLLQ